MKIKAPRLPKIEYVNIRKEFPQMPSSSEGFYFRRYWAGDLIHFGWRHHHFVVDMRKNIVRDLIGRIDNDH